MSLKTLVSVIAALTVFNWHVDAQTNGAPRIWTLQTGATISGNYYSSGNEFVVIKHDGTNCLLRINALSQGDQKFVQAEIRSRNLNAETNAFNQEGLINFSGKIIENFPIENWKKEGWMDAEFRGVQQYAGRDSFEDLGFYLKDDDGNLLMHCAVDKDDSELVKAVMGLKEGDKIRTIGTIWLDAAEVANLNHPTAYFIVTKIEMIESKAEQDSAETAQ
jgi:hypothetical protein